MTVRYNVQKSRPSLKLGQWSKVKVIKDKKSEKLLSHPHSQCTVGRAP